VTERWIPGNTVQLFENGEEFFPEIIEAMGNAEHEILIETFILRDDKVGKEVQKALIAATRRGVKVALTVDGYGSYFLSDEYVKDLTAAGVHFCMYDPPPKWMSFRTNVFRRLHRKLITIDGRLAYVGGINLSYNHMCEYGPEGKQDYAVAIQGPIVSTIRDFLVEELEHCFNVDAGLKPLPAEITPEQAGGVEMLFVTRDNNKHHTDIENEYLNQIRCAQREITIANAYFFPGYRVLKELRNATRRGVRVRLIIQGKPGSMLAMKTAPMLYDFLAESQMEVYEYWERPLHGKVAVIDGEWATVGSSNLDPLSLSLNLEANVFIRDKEFSKELLHRMELLIEQSDIRRIHEHWPRRRTVWRWIRSLAVFHFLRHFPAWVGWLPAHAPRIRTGQRKKTDTNADYTNHHENC
jgi:cardiolipin synthase